MSGHNKWSKIKNVKAANDAANSKVYSKLGREITVAVKLGGPDPNSNPRLKTVIAKARAVNMPNDNITRNIKKASGEDANVNYDSITYEGYGVAGSAVMVYALTDNKNRTASDVRHLFDKFGGSLGATGCVNYLFDRKGVIVIEKGHGISDDDMMMYALDGGADDVEINDDCFVVYTSPDAFEGVKAYFDQNKIEYAEADLDMVPQNYVSLPADKIATFQKFLNALDDNDDVQNVYHNVDNLPEE